MSKKSEPAFPIRGFCADANGALAGENVEHKGMTLRDWFAGRAMVALIAADKSFDLAIHGGRATADMSYKMADAMIVARQKKG